MKRGNFDSLVPSEQTPISLTYYASMNKEEIISEIETAFHGVKLNGGTSLEQARVIDNYGRGVSAQEFAGLPQNESTEDLSDIPVDLLESFDCIAFLDEKGLKYYLPAFMLRILDNYDASTMMTIGTFSALYPKNETQKANLSELNIVQRRAIALFLKNLPNLVELWGEDVPRVERAFNQYWSKYVSE